MHRHQRGRLSSHPSLRPSHLLKRLLAGREPVDGVGLGIAGFAAVGAVGASHAINGATDDCEAAHRWRPHFPFVSGTY